MEKIPFGFEKQPPGSESLPEDSQMHSSEEKKEVLPSSEKAEGFTRRDFLKMLGTGAAVAAVELAGLNAGAEAKGKKKQHEYHGEKKKKKQKEKQERQQENPIEKIKRELFETREILPCHGKKFKEKVEVWRKRYAGEDEEYDRLVLLYKKRKGMPLKTIHGELKEGWQRLVSSADLQTVYTVTKAKSVPFDLIFLALSESHWKKKAVSRVGAVGPWQFMPETAREWGLRVAGTVDERLNIPKSTAAACNFLKRLYERTFITEVKKSKKGKKIERLLPVSENDRWVWAFWAYNYGHTRVLKDLKRTKGDPNKYFQVCDNKESREYAPKIFGLAQALHEIEYKKTKKESHREVTKKLSPADTMYDQYVSKKFFSAQERIKFLEKIIDTYEREGEKGIHTEEYVENAVDVVYEEIQEVKKTLRAPQSGIRKGKLEIVETKKGDRKIMKPRKREFSKAEEDEVPTVMYKIKAGDNATKIATWLAPSPQKVGEVEDLIRVLNPKVRNWNSLRRGQSIVVPGTMIEVPEEKLAAILKRYYPGTNPDLSEKYLKWLNDKDPSSETIQPGEMILVPVDPKELE